MKNKYEILSDTDLDDIVGGILFNPREYVVSVKRELFNIVKNRDFGGVLSFAIRRFHDAAMAAIQNTR